MSSFIVTGKLGGGKSLVTVGKAFDYLAQNRKVATNLNIYLDKYLNKNSKKSVVRLPDKPTIFDLNSLGSGNDTYDEDNNGLLILDELGTWFNSRNWQDKSRQSLIEWFLHARKKGWDTMLIVQDIDMIDKQLVGSLAEHLVICRRLDRVKIPFIGGFMQNFGLKGKLPKIHRAKVHYGETAADMVVDTWTYRGRVYYPAYDTKQEFSHNYSDGAFSYLSPWHTIGRHSPGELSLKQRIASIFDNFVNPPRVRIALKPKNLLIERLMKLPDPEQRLEFFRRFQQCGAI